MPLHQFETMQNLYPNFKDCSIQIFDDNKERKDGSLARVINQNEFGTNELMRGLDIYNNKKGCGIFFSVNSMVPGKRNKESVTNINAWICECDDKTKDEQMQLINSCPLKPSMVVESKKSFHMYWFAKGGTKENWNKICRGLCNYFGGDNGIIEISRVLRVPGFNHMKNPEAPFMCNIISSSGEYYTEEDMLNAYPNTISLREKKEEEYRLEEYKRKQEKYKNESDGAWYKINALDNMQMLEEISGHQMVSYEHFSFQKNSGGYQIVCNGKASGAWIDRNGLIGSNDNGGPTRVNRVKWYGIFDDKDIYKRIKENHPECIPEKNNQTKLQNYKQAVDENNDDDLFEDYKYEGVDFSSVVPFTRGLPCIDNKFGKIDYGKLVAVVGESSAGKTTYTFFQALQNVALGFKVCYISLEQTAEELILLKALKRYGVTKEQRDTKTLDDYQKQKIDEMMKEISSMSNLRITRVPNPTLSRLCCAILKAKSEGYSLFFIDNLGIIQSEKINSKEYDTVTEASRVFMDLAHNEKVTIMLIHHFSQGNSASRALPRPLSDIRGGAKLEHDSDLVCQVRRDLDYANGDYEGDTHIIIQKNRQRGTVGECIIKFDKGGYTEIHNGAF